MVNRSDMLGKVVSDSDGCEWCCRMEVRGNTHSGFNGGLNGGLNSGQIASNSIQSCSKRPYTRSTPLFSNSFRHHVAISLTVLMLVFLTTTNGFNLDIASKMEFGGSMPGSYYGYTVAMLNQGNDDRWLLFGAPKANSTYLPNVQSPGAIYKCILHRDLTGHRCEELFVDDAESHDTVNFDGITRLFIHGREDQWLGASLDVQKGEGIVTCASRWYNKKFETEGYFFMNGLCYEIPLDFNSNNIRKIPALVNGRKQTMTMGGGNVTKLNYGMGNMGGSVHYTSQGEDLLLGAPGLRTFTGGFIDLRQTEVYMTEYRDPPTEISEMAGYAMTSGKYFGGTQNYFAIGAPRDQLTGKVFIFGADRVTFMLEEADLTLNGSEVTEIPVNGFYGAALCSADVNKDGLDDLLVAAPFYSKGDKEETGVVMVYLGKSDMKFEPMSTMLTGSDAYGARFGSSIARLGDINKDMYEDIVVGAPYEDDLQGAIYVYNGCSTGIWPHFSQRVPAASLRNGLMSFGISFSKPEDMNNDGVNDIAVGAYLSDRAYLLFGQSVINIDITVETSISQIDKDTTHMCPSTDRSVLVPCFTVDVCFHYLYRQIGVIDVNVTARLDTYMGEYSRVAWRTSADSVESFSLRLFTGDKTCIGQQDVLIKSTSDLVTPVRIKASYEVLNIPSSSGIKPTINKFDGANPNKQILFATKILDFKKNCPNNDCRTDIHLTAVTDYDEPQHFFIIGTSSLVIDVTITKTGHPCYSSNFFISFPNSLQFQKVKKIYGDDEINCGFVADESDDAENDDMESLDYLQRQSVPEVSEDELLMVCSFGNPMHNDSGVRFQLAIHVPDSINNTKLQFRLNATTLSTELQPADNVQNITVEIRNQLETTFVGVSRPSYVTMRDTAYTYLASHIYELRNKGPSPLPSSNLMILYPQIQKEGTPSLYLNKTTWSCTPPCRIKCSYPDSPNTAPVVFAANIGPTYAVEETLQDENLGESRTIANMRNIDCKDGGCSRYECDLHDIPPREGAVVTLEYVVTGNILETTSDGEALTIRSEAYVRIRELHRLISDTTEHFTDISTDLLPVSPPPQHIPWWMILVSVLAGLILIVVLVLILWKIGFFRRKQMEEMKRMQHGVEVEKMLPDEELNNVKS